MNFVKNSVNEFCSHHYIPRWLNCFTLSRGINQGMTKDIANTLTPSGLHIQIILSVAHHAYCMAKKDSALSRLDMKVKCIFFVFLMSTSHRSRIIVFYISNSILKKITSKYLLLCNNLLGEERIICLLTRLIYSQIITWGLTILTPKPTHSFYKKRAGNHKISQGIFHCLGMDTASSIGHNAVCTIKLLFLK